MITRDNRETVELSAASGTTINAQNKTTGCVTVLGVEFPMSLKGGLSDSMGRSEAIAKELRVKLLRILEGWDVKDVLR